MGLATTVEEMVQMVNYLDMGTLFSEEFSSIRPFWVAQAARSGHSASQRPRSL